MIHSFRPLKLASCEPTACHKNSALRAVCCLHTGRSKAPKITKDRLLGAFKLFKKQYHSIQFGKSSLKRLKTKKRRKKQNHQAAVVISQRSSSCEVQLYIHQSDGSELAQKCSWLICWTVTKSSFSSLVLPRPVGAFWVKPSRAGSLRMYRYRSPGPELRSVRVL